MATWIAHLRVAENILNQGFKFDKIPFVVGNIGPDAGMPNEDWSQFSPPTEVTHWKEGKNIEPEKFWDKYIKNLNREDDFERYSFLMGYYIHLLTDNEWSWLLQYKKEDPLYCEGLSKNKNFIWTIKKDLYGLDFKFLEDNPNCIFHTCFKYIKHVSDYLDYFPPKAFEVKVDYIKNYYLGENEETKDGFIYLNEEEMDRFVDKASSNIINRLTSVI
ncbi:MAG: hypothetical protein K0R09_1492 [Clostridiales bacterium]|nr:hypothetical protein [Clostridiales bacterium]